MTVCDRGEGGSKIIKNSVTYFMDGPIGADLSEILGGPGRPAIYDHLYIEL